MLWPAFQCQVSSGVGLQGFGQGCKGLAPQQANQTHDVTWGSGQVEAQGRQSFDVSVSEGFKTLCRFAGVGQAAKQAAHLRREGSTVLEHQQP